MMLSKNKHEGLILKKSNGKQHIVSQWDSQNITDDLSLTTKIESSVRLTFCT